ncbi:MAG: hypothetical protein IPK63_19555 [Candidatus Competibacteraceae bacterium]|nr:hypothetical protein [Candidatus Competibacteraceae bacterium]
MVAARFRDYYERQAKERQGHGQTAPGQTLPVNLPEAIKKSSDARDAAGKEFGVSGKSVDHATKVLEVLPRARGPNRFGGKSAIIADGALPSACGESPCPCFQML